MTGFANGGQADVEAFPRRHLSHREGRSGPADPLGAGARFAELNYRIARNMADAEQRPMWYAGDYFGETFAPTQPKAKRQAGGKP